MYVEGGLSSEARIYSMSHCYFSYSSISEIQGELHHIRYLLEYTTATEPLNPSSVRLTTNPRTKEHGILELNQIGSFF